MPGRHEEEAALVPGSSGLLQSCRPRADTGGADALVIRAGPVLAVREGGEGKEGPDVPQGLLLASLQLGLHCSHPDQLGPTQTPYL